MASSPHRLLVVLSVGIFVIVFVDHSEIRSMFLAHSRELLEYQSTPLSTYSRKSGGLRVKVTGRVAHDVDHIVNVRGSETRLGGAHGIRFNSEK
jgi:hypothetical protein